MMRKKLICSLFSLGMNGKIFNRCLFRVRKNLVL